ncbi:MAG: trypsin-like peptidase domain-containing protein [Alphaproteobacteria bacterium]|nr:trypsin-like peptidase domain-containing protein [Alphaproteobacteria bacterium]
MTRIFRLLCAIASLTALTLAPAQADTQDVAAAARGVVRVILVATDGDSAYFVGHGSGIAVAPDKILTNAHVIEMTRDEKSIVIGVIPSEGRKSYGGKVIAYSPGNDLALIQLTEGRIPVDTFYSGAVMDGQPVVAIGYPGAVDRAQGLNLQDMIEPLSPVKSSGTVSAGRSSRQYDTLLHTAPMASGNSGGPLVDVCGRVLGINSFGSMSDGNDAEFGFAISNREIASFLRQAGVQFARTTIECQSPEEAQDEETRRIAIEQAKLEAERRANDDAHRAAMTAARDKAEQQIINERENAMAIAAILLALAVLGAGGSVLLLNQDGQDKRTLGIRLGIGGGIALIGAIIVFVTRPGFSGIDDRAQLLIPKDVQAATNSYTAAGQNICRINEARSRITVSDVSDVTLNWTNGGCVNGRTQFGHEGGQWSRSFVPNNEATVDIRSFDPGMGRYSVERYLLDAGTIEQAREIRARYKVGECTADPAALAKLATMEGEIQTILPPRPNERLVYNCGKAK